MSVPIDPNVNVESCSEQAASIPPQTGTDLIEKQSAGMVALMQAIGVDACTQTTAAGVTFIPVPVAGGVQVSVGCEQIALISSAMNASQKILQCTLFSQSSTQSLTARQTLTLRVNIVDSDFNCRTVIRQVGGMKMVRYSEMSADIKKQLSGELQSSMEAMIETIQKKRTEGLFPDQSAQKLIQQMTFNLDQMVENDSFTKIVQEQLEQYENTGTVDVSWKSSNILLALNNVPNEPCLEVTQGFFMQVVSQTMLQTSLEELFKGSAANDMVGLLKGAQESVSIGFQLPQIGATIIIIIIVIIVLILLFTRKPNNSGSGGTSSLNAITGKPGIILGSIIMVLGIAAIISGVVLLLLNKINDIVNYLIIVAGAILFIVGLIMLLRSKSQLNKFEQNLQVAQASRAT